jgi:hypothetical protein
MIRHTIGQLSDIDDILIAIFVVVRFGMVLEISIKLFIISIGRFGQINNIISTEGHQSIRINLQVIYL